MSRMQPSDSRSSRGFTIVELLIVIVVIGILASISIVAYVGIQERARETAIKSDLRQAQTHIELAKANTGEYPTNDDGIPKSSSTELEYRPDGDSYCLAGRTDGTSEWKYYVANDTPISEGSCRGRGYAGTPPAGADLMSAFSQWTLSGGATYDASTGEITIAAGSYARSPLVKVDGPKTWHFSAEMNGPVSSHGNANGRTEAYSTTSYYNASKGSYKVIGGWTGNGNAVWVSPANAWTNYVWAGGTSQSGPGLMYMTMTLRQSGGNGVPNTKYRNPSLTITR